VIHVPVALVDNVRGNSVVAVCKSMSQSLREYKQPAAIPAKIVILKTLSTPLNCCKWTAIVNIRNVSEGQPTIIWRGHVYLTEKYDP
jgi:hypothetical protein